MAITVSMEAYISPLTSSPRIMPAGVGNGDLYDVTVLLYGEGDVSLRIFREILIQLGNLLSHQIAEIIGYLDVFSIDRNTHIRFPFPRSGIAPY